MRTVQPNSPASNANARIIIITVLLIETAMKYSFSYLALIAPDMLTRGTHLALLLILQQALALVQI
jgi:hypothetical protein